jgi:excisionase family DNA binding protein
MNSQVMERSDPLELMTLQELSRLARRSHSALYADIRAGRLKVVKLGRSTRIPRAEVERYLAGEPPPGGES